MNWYKFSQNDEKLKEEIDSIVKQLRLKYTDLELYAFLSNSGYIEIAQIQLPPEKQNQGIGSFIIHTFQELGIKHNVPIVVRPEPDRGKKKSLDRFYKQHGFVDNKGRNKNYELSSPFSKTKYWKPEQ